MTYGWEIKRSVGKSMRVQRFGMWIAASLFLGLLVVGQAAAEEDKYAETLNPHAFPDGLLFTGEGNGQFKAYDSATGNVLWNFQAGAGVNAPPASYTVDGKQYIVVGAGGNVQMNYKRGNNIIAFTLAD